VFLLSCTVTGLGLRASVVILGDVGGVEWLLLGTAWAGWLLGVGSARDSLICEAERRLREKAELFLLEL
jgi:hypothetical protein